MRRLRVLGARALLASAIGKNEPVSRWALQIRERRGYGRALVAIAAKNARMCWAMWHLQDEFRSPV
nr:hypothetical protein SYMBAF_160076 [Serratia symbiotica]